MNADAIDVPVTVVLRGANFNFADSLSAGTDIIFVDHRTNPAGVVLPFQRASFNAGQQNAVFYVRVPRFNAAAQTDSIFMYFRRAGAPEQQNVAGTFNDHLAVWHMDGLPGDGATNVSDNAILETRTGQAATFVDGNVVRSLPGLLGTAAVVDGGNNGAGAFDSFIILPPLGASVSNGSVSVIVGPLNASGMTGSGCGIAACGHVWFMGRAQGSLGFDGNSAHLTFFDADAKVGVSRPSNPSSANQFVAATAGGAFDPLRFNVVTVTWDAATMNITTTRLDATGNVVTVSTSAARNVVPFTVTNFVIGVAEFNATNQPAGAFGGSVDELRVSAAARSPAFVRAEALSHLERLLTFGASVAGP